MVPELGLGDDLVAREQPDGINLRGGVRFGRQLASHHEVLPDLNK